MKSLILTALFVVTASAVENYSGPEWDPIDWSRVVDPVDIPGFWDNTEFAGKFPSPNPRNRRIVGGQEAVPNSHPYQVSQLHTRLILTSLCGGSVIRPTIVLTAAHCPINTQTTTVITGAHDRTLNEPNQQRRTVPSANYILHPQYNTQNLNNDIALLRFTEPLTFNSFVQPISLATSNAPSFVGETATTTGWGRVSDSGTSSNVLRVVTNRVISNADCAAVFGSTVVNEAVICVDTTGGRGSCSGDSGGPLTLPEGSNRLQIGVVSFGASAGCEVSFLIKIYEIWSINIECLSLDFPLKHQYFHKKKFVRN